MSVVLRRRVGLMLLLMAMVVGALVFPFPMEGRLWGEIFNLAHAPVFCVTLLLLVGLPDPSAVGLSSQFVTVVPITFRRASTIAGALMTVGIVCEYLQRFAGRNPSIADLMANTTGIVAGILWIWFCTSTLSGNRIRQACLPLLLLLAISLPTLFQIEDCVQQIGTFPQIASFERRFELDGWAPNHAEIRATNAWSTEGEQSLEVALLPATYSGTMMLWFERDWSSYRFLNLDFQNPGTAPLTIVVKLHDREHRRRGFPDGDHFYQVAELHPESEATVRVRLDDVRVALTERDMDLQQMAVIEIFSIDIQRRSTFRVDNIRLSR